MGDRDAIEKQADALKAADDRKTVANILRWMEVQLGAVPHTVLWSIWQSVAPFWPCIAAEQFADLTFVVFCTGQSAEPTLARITGLDVCRCQAVLVTVLVTEHNHLQLRIVEVCRPIGHHETFRLDPSASIFFAILLESRHGFSKPSQHATSRDVYRSNTHTKLVGDIGDGMLLDTGHPKRLPCSRLHLLSNLSGRPAEHLTSVLQVEYGSFVVG